MLSARNEWDLVVDDRGMRIRVTDWGGEGLPIVILHGLLEQGAAWDRVARLVQEQTGGRRVIAPDHRGHGRSGHVGAGGWYHFWDYVGDLDLLVQHLGGRIDLVGHSMGGTVACLFAGARPDAVRRLVLVDGLGPPGGEDPVGRARAYLDGRRAPPTHGAPMADLAAAVDRMRRFNPGIDDEVAGLLAERTTAAEPGGGRSWSWDALHRGRSPSAFDGGVFCAFLREIRAPVLSIVGGRSPFPSAEWTTREAAIRDRTRHVEPDVGHMLHHEAPVALAARIAAFVGDAS